MKNAYVLHSFSSFEGTSCKSYKAQLPVLLFLVVLYQLCQGIKFLALSMRCLCSAYFAQLFVSQKCLPIESYFLPVQTKEDHI